MLHQRFPTEYFPGDEPAQAAVREMANPAARYAEMTRRLGGNMSAEARSKLLRDARELKGLIEARAKSGGIVSHEMDAFWAAVQAEASAKYRRKIEIFALPEPVQPKVKVHDPIERELELAIIDLEERYKRAGARLSKAQAKLAAHRVARVAA